VEPRALGHRQSRERLRREQNGEHDLLFSACQPDLTEKGQ